MRIPLRARRGFAIALFAVSFGVGAQERQATATFAESEWLSANTPFDIVLTGEGTGTVAIVLDRLDVSALFERVEPAKLRYEGTGPALPAGEHTLEVYDVDAAGTWTQIGQFAIRLLSPRGFVSSRVEPSMDLTGKGQLGERHSPDANAPERTRFRDATSQLGIRTEFVRPEGALRAEAQVAGVTDRNEALRFGTEGPGAPRVDLAGFRIDLQRGSKVLSAGHLGFGSMRHLISGFQSRGVSLTLGESQPVSLQLAVLNGSSIVGWNNVLGLDDDEHRVWGATLGVEAFRHAPGKLRLEYAHFRGSTRPFTGFNQGGVVTAETSRGNAIRIVSSIFDGRARFDGGYSESRFESRLDEQVESGLDVTPIENRKRSAWYSEASIELLKDRKIASTTAGATLTLRLEDIEPLFRSLGVSVQPDLRSRAADLVFNVGAVTGTASHLRTRDNLAGITSILTTRTERTAIALGIPVGAALGVTTGTRWLPIISVQADALHQFGDGVPIGGDFTIESIPDLENRNLLLSADWQAASTLRAGVKVSTSSQDDLQVGREDQDTVTRTRALTFGWTPHNAISIGGELGLDRHESVAQRRIDSTLRWATTLEWTIYKELAFAGSITNIRAWDDLDTRQSENVDAFLELSTRFRLSRTDRRKGRIFVRWTDRQSDVLERTIDLRDSRRNAAFATGLTLSVF